MNAALLRCHKSHLDLQGRSNSSTGSGTAALPVSHQVWTVRWPLSGGSEQRSLDNLKKQPESHSECGLSQLPGGTVLISACRLLPSSEALILTALVAPHQYCSGSRCLPWESSAGAAQPRHP